MQRIACDSHKHYTWALVQDEVGRCLATLPGHEPRRIRPSGTKGSATCPQDTQGTA